MKPIDLKSGDEHGRQTSNPYGADLTILARGSGSSLEAHLYRRVKSDAYGPDWLRFTYIGPDPEFVFDRYALEKEIMK